MGGAPPPPPPFRGTYYSECFYNIMYVNNRSERCLLTPDAYSCGQIKVFDQGVQFFFIKTAYNFLNLAKKVYSRFGHEILLQDFFLLYFFLSRLDGKEERGRYADFMTDNLSVHMIYSTGISSFERYVIFVSKTVLKRRKSKIYIEVNSGLFM